MTIDHPSDDSNSNVAVYFVYDEVFACIFGESDKVNTILSDLSFNKMEMSE